MDFPEFYLKKKKETKQLMYVLQTERPSQRGTEEERVRKREDGALRELFYMNKMLN